MPIIAYTGRTSRARERHLSVRTKTVGPNAQHFVVAFDAAARTLIEVDIYATEKGGFDRRGRALFTGELSVLRDARTA